MKQPSHIIRVLILFIFTGLVAACSPASPGEVAKKFMTHLSKAEFNEARQYASEQTGQLIEMMGKMGAPMGAKMKKNENYSFILLNEKIEGDKATVEFRNKEGGQVQTMHLIEEKGKWKVHEEKK
ncbi:MAG TPA: DUF4878 domain-containing protein [Gammaproteobacteria bacterium]|nr:DUF4878 domain-containing protein [Gammaproteobacteria bacterium]